MDASNSMSYSWTRPAHSYAPSTILWSTTLGEYSTSLCFRISQLEANASSACLLQLLPILVFEALTLTVATY